MKLSIYRIGFFVSLLVVLSHVSSASAQSETIVLPRPTAPYHLWYQPGTLTIDNYTTYADYYPNITVDGSGVTDPRWIYENRGGTTLKWAYGPNHPNPTVQYFHDRGLPSNRTVTYDDGTSVMYPGFVCDEWLPSSAEAAEICMEGLRQAREEWPDIFIAVWALSADDNVIQLAKEGTIDLIILEAYTYIPDAAIAWEERTIASLNKFKSEGVIDKTIASLGFIDATPDYQNRYMSEEELEWQVREIKRLFPETPGISFFQGNAQTDQDTLDLILLANELSQELWPTPTPEPASLSVLGIGACFLLGKRKKR